MPDPFVSIILPVYNREAFVARAIDSALAQSYPHFELIVIDDGSTDGTARVLESFGERIRVIEQAHAGAYAARNRGLRHARGELIAFADSDDVWFPDRLESQVPLMARAEVGLVFGDATHVLPCGTGSQPVRRPQGGRWRGRGRVENPSHIGLTCFRVAPPRRGRVAAHFAWCCFVPTCTALVRRRCLDEIGGFDESSALSADYLAWFRIALRYELDYVDRPVAEYMVHPGGISYDLGRSLAARIELFSNELARTDDRAVRAVLRRLLFNLALRMVLAAMRGKARNTRRPFRLAWRAAKKVAGLEAAPWTAAFAFYEMRVRTRRLF
jgi:glycosyltransferase involved in cell wall biosynthesis